MLFQAEDSGRVTTRPNTRVSPVSTSTAHWALSKQLISLPASISQGSNFRADSPAVGVHALPMAGRA
ncbi:hypothetical protein [Dyadobacter sp. LHD-138]|uniref:hypothetical protein n=1 Tax=Dyadobacter sp. LHD-138 TaxID=3071413 RepID=UPI0027E04DB0|nr:hypothetical protein [Dyadobacter sp. LHD-138]MDQ6481826.1 hypothetical protein [Dyadobacter sp. LHD-138]